MLSAQNGLGGSVPIQIITTSGQLLNNIHHQDGATHVIQQTSDQHQPIQIHQIQQPQQQQIQIQQQQNTQQIQVQVQQQPTVQQQPQTMLIHSTGHPRPKTHFCQFCNKGFATKHGLILHNKRHPDGGCTERSHVCECGKAFFQKNHLMLHQRQHMDTNRNQQQRVMEQAVQEEQRQYTIQTTSPTSQEVQVVMESAQSDGQVRFL